MENIDKIFLAALAEHLQQRGSQRQLALQVGIEPAYLNQILKGKRFGTDETRRKIAAGLGFEGRKYEDFLEIGRAIVAGKEPPEPEPRILTADEMTRRGFFAVPFSEDMKLSAGGGGTIPITYDSDQSNIVIHGPSLGLRNNKMLQAFRVGGDSMEPLIAKGGLVLADLKRNDIRHIHDGGIYVLCWDLEEGECAVKRLSWAEKGKSLIISSENDFYKPVLRKINEVKLIGKVIWSWREH